MFYFLFLDDLISLLFYGDVSLVNRRPQDTLTPARSVPALFVVSSTIQGLTFNLGDTFYE